MGGIYIVWEAWTVKYCKWCFHTLQLIPTVSIALGCCFWWKTNRMVWELRNVVWSTVSTRPLLQCTTGVWRGDVSYLYKKGESRLTVFCAPQCQGPSSERFSELSGPSRVTSCSGWMLYPVSKLKWFLEDILRASFNTEPADSVKFSSHEWVNGNIHYWGNFFTKKENNCGRDSDFLKVHWASTVSISCGFVFC